MSAPESFTRSRCASWANAVFATMLLLLVCPTRADSVLSIEQMSAEGAQAQGLRLVLHAGESGAEIRLQLDRLHSGGLQWRDLRWRCSLHRSPGQLRCEGPLRIAGQPAGQLRADWNEGLAVDWSRSKARVRLRALAARSSAIEVRISQLPVVWLQQVLDQFYSELRLGEGLISGELQLDTERDKVNLRADLSALALDSRDGSVGVAGVDARVEAQLQTGNEGLTAIELAVGFKSGEGLFGPLYAELAAGSELALKLQEGAGQSWKVSEFVWTDPEQLRLQATATLELGPSASAVLGDWSLGLQAPQLVRSAERYLGGPAAWVGMPGLSLRGDIGLQAEGRGAAIESLSARLSDIALHEPAQRVAASGLQGEVNWSRSDAVLGSELRWSALSMFAIELGESTIQLESQSGRLRLVQPLLLSPFRGRLRIDRLLLDPMAADYAWAASLSDLDLALFTAQLGWPVLQGKLSGTLPGASYADETLSFDGGLRIDVLGGRIDLSQLSMERPFGVAPTLGAEVDVQDLDLSPLTRAFGFGEISGRLDGRIRGLRLLDWSPIAFDARFVTDPDHRVKQRISQRAVQDLSSVGGGLVAGLQNQVLKLFESFAYKRIGLSCRLENNVCHMGGLDSSSAGYTVVEGAGLPRITVNGFQRRVDWPVLMARLRAASSGRDLRIE